MQLMGFKIQARKSAATLFCFTGNSIILGSSKGSICTIQAPPSLDRVESDSQDTTSSTNQRGLCNLP